MGLFSFLSDEDPNAQAQLAMAAGLLGGRGSFNQILSGALTQGQKAGAVAGGIQRQADLDRLAKQRFQLALDEEARKKKQFDAQEAFRASLQSPEQLAVQSVFPQGASPTVENAAKIPPVSPLDTLAFQGMKAGLVSPMEWLNSQRKDKTPMKVGNNERLVEQGTNRILLDAAPEKEPEAIRQLKLIYGEGTPEYQTAIKLLGEKVSTHAPAATQNNYGPPLPVQLPGGGTGYLQPPTRPGAPTQMLTLPGTNTPAVKPKEQSATIQKDIAENTVALGKLDSALDLLGKNPNAVGAKNIVPDILMQRADPAGVETRAAIADIGSQKIHDRSGASVTISEAPRLKPFVPDVRDTPEAAKIKLTRLRKEYAAMQDALTGGATIQQAAKPQGLSKSGWSIEKE